MSGGKGFDPEFLRALKQKNDIIEVIGGYVALDRKGGNHWACCPFHHEKTPSFSVNEAEQFYHCFGCGVSGDVVKFVQEIESTDFIGAVRILAARAKMTVPESNFDTEKAALMKKKRDTMAKVMLDSARFYLSNLYSGDERADVHLQYIQNRKMSPTTVKKFGIGASLDFYGLPDYLAEKGYFKEELIDSGVLTESKSGRLIDSQGGRLIFPIINAFDEVVAFGGRLLEKSDFAKYKNTKETILFNKSKTLYNINLLKKLRREETINNVIIVEGYMDTISLYQAGFRNVVASMGTSLTKDQARLIKRYSENVLISYDGDFAGQKADLRGLEILNDEHLNVRVVPMPEGLDPDDVAKQGKEAYQKCLDEAMPLVDYKIHALERKYDLSKTEDKRQFVSNALKIVKTEDNEIVQEELKTKISNKTGIARHVLEQYLSGIPKEEKAFNDLSKDLYVETERGVNKKKKAIRFILAAKLFFAPYARDYDLSSLQFDEETHQQIAQRVIEHERKGERMRPSELFEFLEEDDPELNAILDYNLEEKLEGKTAEKFFFDSIATLESENIQGQIDSLSKKYNEEEDLKERAKIAKQLQEAIRKKNQLRKR